jgi:hypothetical protein
VGELLAEGELGVFRGRFTDGSEGPEVGAG